MKLRTRILPHTLEYNKIPKHNTTHPPILITLINTTYHIITTYYLYIHLCKIPYAVKISVLRSWRWTKIARNMLSWS